MKAVDLTPDDMACIVDELGVKAILTRPVDRAQTPENAMVMELAGKLNRQDRRISGMFLLSVGQGAELVAELALAAGDADAVDRFMEECIQAIRRKRT